MKLILVLLCLVGITLGHICQDAGFQGGIKTNVPYKGKFIPTIYSDESAKLLTLEQRSVSHIEIQGVLNGSILFKEGPQKEYQQGYLYANINCYMSEQKRKECLLEYISIDKNDLELKVKQLTFSVNVDDGGCVEDFKSKLIQHQTCKIDYYQTSYPELYIPLNNKYEYLKFISKTNTFIYFSDKLFNEVMSSNIDFVRDDKKIGVKLLGITKEFDVNDSCYLLLKNLNDWGRVKSCPNDRELFSFSNMEITQLEEVREWDKVYREGYLELSIEDLRFSIGDKQHLTLKDVNIGKTEIIPYLYYEGYQLSVQLKDDTIHINCFTNSGLKSV
jgi:hypothetical protein